MCNVSKKHISWFSFQLPFVTRLRYALLEFLKFLFKNENIITCLTNKKVPIYWLKQTRNYALFLCLTLQESMKMRLICTWKQPIFSSLPRSVSLNWCIQCYWSNYKGEEAATAFIRAAECQLKLQSKHEAASNYVNASVCLKKVNVNGKDLILNTCLIIDRRC